MRRPNKELVGRRSGGADEASAAVVQLVDEGDEAAGLVSHLQKQRTGETEGAQASGCTGRSSHGAICVLQDNLHLKSNRKYRRVKSQQ